MHNDHLSQLLQQLNDNGITLSAHAGALRVTAPAGAMTETLRDAISRHKAELLIFLAEADRDHAPQTLSASLTPWQRGFWLMQQRDDADLGVLNNTLSLTLHGPMDHRRLQRAWHSVIQRHAILRSHFRCQHDGTAQQAVTAAEAPLTIHHTHGTASRDETVHQVLGKLTTTRFDLENEPPLRGHLVVGTDDEHHLVICIHHIAADGWSFGVFMRELFALYDNEAVILPEPPSYLDYAHATCASWSQPAFRARVTEEGERFTDLPSCHSFPPDFRRGLHRFKPAGSTGFSVPASLKNDLETLARHHNGSLHSVFLTAVAVLHYKLTGEPRLPIMSPVANRTASPALEQCIGTFANAAVHASYIPSAASFSDVLRSVAGDLHAAWDRQDIPFDDALDAARLPRFAGVYPVAQFALASQNAAQLPQSAAFEIEIHTVSAFGRQDFFIELRDTTTGGLDVRIGYDARLFEQHTATALAGALASILSAAATSAGTKLGDLPLTGLLSAASVKPLSFTALGLTPGTTVLFEPAPDSPITATLLKTFTDAGIQTTTSSTEADFVIAADKARLGAAASPQQFILLNHILPGFRTLLTTADGIPLAALDAAGPDEAWAKATPLHADCTIRAWDGSVLPRGLPGLLSTQQGRALHDVAARISATDQLLIRTDTSGSPAGWISGYPVDLDQCAAILMSRLNSADAALSIETRAGTPMLVAWICPAGPGDYATLDTSVRTALRGYAAIDHVVRLSSLPRTCDGRLDRQKLAGLPINAPSAVAPHVTSTAAQITTGTAVRPAPFEHLSDLLPQHDTRFDALPRFDSTGHQRSHNTADSRASGQPALLEGPQLNTAYPDTGWSPVEWLMHAAHSGRNLWTLDYDGSEGHWSFSQLLRRVKKISQGLLNTGISNGTTVIIAARRPADVLALFFAAMHAGVTIAPVPPPRLWQTGDPGFDRLLHVAALTGARHLLINEEISETVGGLTTIMASALEQAPPAQVQHRWASDETMIVSFTSGSTGKPKGVPLCAQNIRAQPLGFGPAFGFSDAEVALNFTSLDHVASLIGFCGSALARGCHLALIPVERFLAAPDDVPDCISRWHVARTWAPDFALSLLADLLRNRPQGDVDFSALRAIYSAGECPLDATFARLSQALAMHGAPNVALQTSWGMAETTSLLTLSQAWDGHQAHSSCNGVIDSGSPVAGSAARIVDGDGRVLQHNETGLFEARGHQVFRRYIILDADGRPQSVNPLTEDGWLKTGDLAYIDRDRVVFLGREKDVLVINGQNIAQAAIEDTVNALSGVDAGFTAAFASRDTKTGEMKLVILFCPEETAGSPVALIRRISGSIATAYGVQPAYVLPVNRATISKTGLGKIQRIKLRDAFEAGTFSAIVRSTDIALENARAVPCIRTRWTNKAIAMPLPHSAGQPVILIDDGTGIATATQRQFARFSVSARCLDAKAVDAAGCVIPAQGAIIVDFRSATAARSVADMVLQRLGLIRALRQSATAPLRVFWVEQDARDPSSLAAAAALAAAIRHEFQNVSGHVLHTGSLSVSRDLISLVTAVLAPLGRHHNQLTLGPDGVLSAKALVRATTTPALPRAPFPDAATVLLAGGTGAVGSVLLPLLLSWTRWNFVTVSRTTPTLAGSSPRLSHICADLIDAGSLKSALAGYSIDGVINLTGRVKRTPLDALDHSTLTSEIALRTNIFRTLDTHFSGQDIPIVHITSVNADFGRHDFLGYSLANAVQRSLTQQASSDNPHHLCLSCGQWQAPSGPTAVNRYLEPLGFPLISPETGAATVLRALTERQLPDALGIDIHGSETAPFASIPLPLDRVVISARTNPSEIARLHEKLHPLGTQISIPDTTETVTVTGTKAEARIRDIWRVTLDIAGDVPLDANFFDLGGTSLLAARLLLRLQENFGGPSDVIALFSHATIRAQARLLAAPPPPGAPAPQPRLRPPPSQDSAGHSVADRRRAALAKLSQSRE